MDLRRNTFIRIARAQEHREGCDAFPMFSCGFLHLKCYSICMRRQREKITLHRPRHPGPSVASYFTVSVPHNRVSEFLPNSLSPNSNEATGDEVTTGSPTFQGGFPMGLGTTDPCPSTVHMETYSASVFRVLNRIIATTTKICTRCTIARRLTPNASTRAPRPPTRLWLKLPNSRRTIGDLLEHRPFSGLVHSAGELLHTP